MKKLGLNPTETEIQDLINEVEMNGYIYYPEFCRIIMRKMREDDEENFHQGRVQQSLLLSQFVIQCCNLSQLLNTQKSVPYHLNLYFNLQF